MNRKQKQTVMRILVFAGVALLLGGCLGTGFSPFGFVNSGGSNSFATNGERIYYSGTSANDRISYSGGSFGGMMGGGMMRGRLACADCHGDDGRGGNHFMGMTVMNAPDIRWTTLTASEHDGAEMDHPPYDFESFKRAITEGVAPDDDRLRADMPRWRMSDQDVADLIAFLQQLP